MNINPYSTAMHDGFEFSSNEVKEFLNKCNLNQYYNVFIEEGFESLQAVMEITEEDLIALNVKRGHRRVIQRRIATLVGIPKNQPLMLTTSNNYLKISHSQTNQNGNNSSEGSSGTYTLSSGYGSMDSSPSTKQQPDKQNNQSIPFYHRHHCYSLSQPQQDQPQPQPQQQQQEQQQQQQQSESTSSSENTTRTHRNGHNLLQHILRHSPPSNDMEAPPSTNANKVNERKERSSYSSNDDYNDNNNMMDGAYDKEDSVMLDDEQDGNYGVKTKSPSPRTSMALKRKYKRHPKPDRNAPIKPPSAYIMFSNHARAQLKDRGLSFVDIAKIVGDQWKNLDPYQKRSYERTAMKAKDEYVDELNRYRQTNTFKNYQKYLKKFKSEQDAINRKIARLRKRAKQESPGSGSLADNSSNGNTNDSSIGSNSTDGFNGDARSSSSSGSNDNYNNLCDEKNKSNASSNTAVNNTNNEEQIILDDDENGDDCYSPQGKPPSFTK